MVNLFDLPGRKALVTGGATGIGKGIALDLAAAGVDVALTYRSHQPEETLAEIRAVVANPALFRRISPTWIRPPLRASSALRLTPWVGLISL